MKLSITARAFLVTVLPVVLSLPTSLAAEPHPVASCAIVCLNVLYTSAISDSTQEQCLLEEPVPKTFEGCNPSDLACLCRQNQGEVTRYVHKAQVCIDDPALGGKACTPGGRYGKINLTQSVNVNIS